MSTQTKVTCPNCSTKIDVNEILYHKLEEDIQKKFNTQVEEHRSKYKDAMSQLKVKELQIKEQEEHFNERLQETLQKQLKTDREQLSHSIQSQENKSDKMSILYTYLTSTEFRMQIEAIVEGFTQMQSDLDSEKRALGRIWKQREKQILKVLDNTVGMYGSIRGIAGNAIGNIEMLELPTGGEEIENEAVD